MQTEGERERVVPTDRDQRVDPEVIQHLHHVRGVVASLVIDAAGLQEVGLVGRSDLRRVRPRGVQDRAARPIDRPHGVRVQRECVSAGRIGIGGIDLQQPRPASADPDHLVPVSDRAIRRGLDAGVQPGDVSPAGEDADAHGSTLQPALDSLPEEHLGFAIQLGREQVPLGDGLHEGHVPDVLGLPGDHPAPAARGRQIGGGDPEAGPQDPIEGDG